ncbi:hypothetical protein SASPL_100325 [Salvia splendens]|uniref:Dynein light chain n=1 Tax=Salvia splendens TaxID=180675 RepID=A0A8X8YSH9_SALSN|nr:hypothetical protein SASPL_100325 [Salvia splendens]
MSEDTKRNGTGEAAPSVDDRKSSIGSNPSKKVVIKNADMKEDIQKEAIDVAIGAFEKFSVEKDVAEYIKKTFDKKYGPTWHCIVGKNYGIQNSSRCFYLLFIAWFPLDIDEGSESKSQEASRNANRHVMGFNMGFMLLDYMVTLEHIDCCYTCSYVTHETNHFVYFYLDTKAVLLFKSG